MLLTLFLPFLTFLLGVLVCFVGGQWWRWRRQQQYKLFNPNEYHPLINRKRRRPDYTSSKKGGVWLLKSEKVSELTVKRSGEQKKKEVIQVYPAKKYAKVEDHSLILSDNDGSKESTIELLDCAIVAVSASNLPSRKWDKRYPIRIESKNFILNSPSKVCYLYLDTCWEKESWCEALRLASCHSTEKLEWYLELREEYQKYLASSSSVFSASIKPPTKLIEVADKSNKVPTPLKAILSLKRIPKKISSSGGEKKTGDKLLTSDNMPPTIGLMNMNSHLHKFPSKTKLPVFTTKIPDEKFVREGSSNEDMYCWNLLITRLFFDAKRSLDINDLIKGSISAMRTPDNVKITCTSLELGDLSPKIQNMRHLPSYTSELWVVEFDLEYLGGIVLDINISLSKQPELQKMNQNKNDNSNLSQEVNLNLCEGIDENGNKHQYSDESVQSKRITNWASTLISTWKSITNSINDQDSQVLISLVLKVESFRGTLRLYIKPPPSNQLWYGFTSMPNIDWNLEPVRGIRDITSNDISHLIDNLMKDIIQETVVLPNCEYLTIPWMLAEDDDWVPQNVAPFVWINEETAGVAKDDIKDNVSDIDRNNVGDDYMDDRERERNVIHSQNPSKESFPDMRTPRTNQPGGTIHNQSFETITSKKTCPSLVTSPNQLESETNQSECSSSSYFEWDEALENQDCITSDSFVDSYSQLLECDVLQDNHNQSKVESPMNATTEVTPYGELTKTTLEKELKPRKTSRRAIMMDYKKKMEETLEEKKRHIEEKASSLMKKYERKRQ